MVQSDNTKIAFRRSGRVSSTRHHRAYDKSYASAPGLRVKGESSDSSDESFNVERIEGLSSKLYENMMQRKNELETDPWISEEDFGPKSVMCKGCLAHIKLDVRQYYYSTPWRKHANRCSVIRTHYYDANEEMPKEYLKADFGNIAAERILQDREQGLIPELTSSPKFVNPYPRPGKGKSVAMNASTSPSVCVSAGGKSQRSSGSSSSSTPKSTPATDSSRVSPISSYSSYCPPSAQPSAYPSASPSTSTSPAEISRSSPVLSYPSDSLPSSQHSTLTRRAVEDDLYGDVLVKSVWERMLEIRKEEAASNKLTEKDYQFLSTVGYFEVEEGQVPRKSLKYCRNATDCHSF